MSNYISPTNALEGNQPGITGDLPTHKCSLDADQSVQFMVEEFNSRPYLSGTVVISKQNCQGMISRNLCFEQLGRPFGREVFLRRTILDFLSKVDTPSLLIPCGMKIHDAVQIALSRSPNHLYDPIVVDYGAQDFRLLDMHVLLLAQSRLLESANHMISRLAVTDSLTNINNRRGFFEHAQPGIHSACEANGAICALMIDIDHFKAVNDIYGHVIGDQVLRAIAEQCRRGLREEDILGRFGGEEFIVLLIDANLENGMLVAERLRSSIEQLVVMTERGPVSVTVSIGIAQSFARSTTLDALLQHADQALYDAKGKGRNRIAIWSHPAVLGSFSVNLQPPLSDVPYDSTPLPTLCFSRDDYETLDRAYDHMIAGWILALELRDKETEGHTQRVTDIAVELGRRLGFGESELVQLRRGALLHDIGKIAIPDDILLKPGKLTEAEWVIMKKHPQYAYEMLSPIQFLRPALEIPYCHHEQWNGNGYPQGLKGEAIPLAARLFSIVDVWDALKSDRPYRPAWGEEEARAYILQQSGFQFDPVIVSIFIEMLDCRFYPSYFTKANLPV